MINSEFSEHALLALASRLKRFDPTVARNAYLESLSVAMVETPTAGGQGAMGSSRVGGNNTARVHTPGQGQP